MKRIYFLLLSLIVYGLAAGEPVKPAAAGFAPVNDDPCNAVLLTVSAGCTYTTFTNAAATPTAGVADPFCSNYNGADVWFRITVPAGGSLIIDTQTGTVTDGAMALYSGSCSALTEIECDDDSSPNGSMPLIAASGLTPGTTVWVRFFAYGTFPPGTFGICVTAGAPAVTNNDPCGAINLPVTATCTFATFTNAGATATTGVPAPPCGSYAGSDVWFKITVPAAGSVSVTGNYGTMFDGDMAIYSGSCTALTLLACDDDSSPNAPMPAIHLTGQTPGAVLWVRFWGNGNSQGTFRLCASLPPPPTVQDCPGAIPICQSIYHENDSYTGVGNIGNEINPQTSCLEAGERSDVWYTFTVQNSGNLNFTITPNNFFEDYDWQVFNITGHTCAELFTNPSLSVSCNFSATGGNTGPTGGSTLTSQDASGTPFNAQIPVFAGQTYMLNVSNYSLSTNGYTLNFTASSASIFDNTAPTLQSINAASACGGNQLSVNFSENVLCSTLQNADFAITGPGGPYTVTGWSSASCTSGALYGNNIDLTVSPAIASSGTFQVCLTTLANSVTDLCGNVAPPACFSFNINVTTPTFSAFAPYCAGQTAPVLPTTSINGITGTWTPATVSNTASGTYTFNPAAGQCAAAVSISITVNPAGTPAFNSFGPICSGGTAPVLPTTSNNGITGTWNPATVSNTASGTYTFTPNANQCAGPVSVTVTVNPSGTPAFNSFGPICSGETAPVLPATSNNGITGTWNPATVSNTASGTYTFTPNANQCAGPVSVTVTVNPSGTPAFNSFGPICSGSTPPALPTTSTNGITGTWNPAVVSNTASGNYTFTPAAGQCSSPVTVSITVNPVPTSNSFATVCADALPYAFNGQSFSAAGTYSVTLTSSAGCDSIAVLNLSVTPLLVPQFSPINSFCAGTTAPALPPSDVNGITGTWSPATVSNSSSGSYTFTPNAGQCADIKVLDITVTPLPAAPQVNTPVLYCQNAAAVSLAAAVTDPAGILLWYSSAAGGSGSATAPVPATVNTGTTDYYVSRTINGCEGPRTRITVQVSEAPNLGADRAVAICFGATADLTGLYSFAGLTGNWTRNNVPVTNPAAIRLPGIYRLIVTGAGGCADTATVEVTVVTLPRANAGNDSIAEFNTPFQLAGSGGGQYQWSPATVLNDPFAANPVATLTADETFVLTVTNSAGCESTDTVKIRVLNGPAIYVPSAFTPNGDGMNDIFRPVSAGIVKMEFRVFNRYGQLLFESRSIASGWDGKLGGVPQPIGNYVWQLKATDREGAVKQMKGSVILIR